MTFSEDFLQELKYKVDIESVISPYVTLRKRGKTLTGLCPFHNEKTPSFTVYPDTQSFFCFGCSSGGDAITFIRNIENLDYVEAVKSLAQRFSIPVPELGVDEEGHRRKMRVLEANRAAARFFHQNLMEEAGKQPLQYLLARGLLPKTIKQFGLGYAKDSWQALYDYMRQKGFTPEELYEANLAKRSNKQGNIRYYDNFRNRLMFPIIDIRGNIIAFGGRVMDDSKPKYINTSDTIAYKKSRGVFALNFAKDQNDGTILLAEGYMDVMALQQAGFRNAVACLGTALTAEQARLVSRYAEEVVLAYDGDAAGQKATKRAMELFRQTGVDVRILPLTGGKDPDEIIKKKGAEGFQALLLGAANDIEYQLLQEREKYDLSLSDEKIKFLNRATQILAEVGGKIERDVYAGKLAEELSVQKETILNQIIELEKKKKRKAETQNWREIQKETLYQKSELNPQKKEYARACAAEELLIQTLFFNPDYLERLEGILPEDAFFTDFNQKIFRLLVRQIQEGMEPELSRMGSELNQNEMGWLAGLIAKGHGLGYRFSTCEDCVKTLQEEKEKLAAADAANLDDDAFRALFQKPKNT